MANVLHSSLTGSELHEPKGADTATVDETYFSDGAGSGTWKKIYTMGWEDVNDSGSSQSLSTSFVDLTNDGAGSNTTTTYLLPGYSTAWDTANNQFDWDGAGFSLGDVVKIRVDAVVTTAATNSQVQMGIDMAHGDAAEFRLVFGENQFKTAGTHQIVENIILYMGSTAVLTNPAKLIMKSDNASDTVVLNGFAIYAHPLQPVLD